MDQAVGGHLQRLGYDDVRPGHLAVLLDLERSGVRSAELARRAGMTRQSMGELVAELEALDYVERRPDPGDKRARLVLPTGRGLILIAHARRAVAQVEADAARWLGRERYAQLEVLLTDLAVPEPESVGATET
ncbi:MAG: MarR family transcriptional regulator [Chloroflexota bacterium]|nr:MarR family transcriptional regulator [Chloroflexota bacterium]